jgi:hypothetical protein
MLYSGLRPQKVTSLAIGATSTAGTAVSPNVKTVRIAGSQPCWVNLNSAAAVGTGWYMPTTCVDFLSVSDGDWFAVIEATGSSAGTLSITEMGH